MDSPDELHQKAVEQVREWVLLKFSDSIELPAGELSQSSVSNAAAGWKLPHDDGYLALILDRNFPYSEPRFIAEGLPAVLGGPHIEEKGKICVAGDSGRIDALRAVDVVGHSYQEALNLLAENKANANDADFSLDFGAYWHREAKGEGSLKTIISAQGPSRTISAWSGKSRIAADSKEVLTRFLRNMKYDDKPEIKTGFAVSAKSLPTPKEYPTTVDGLRKLVKSISTDGLEVLDKAIAGQQFPTFGVFFGPTGEGRPAGIAGIRIGEKPLLHRPGNKIQDPLNKGFRPGKVPPAILSQRLALTRLSVDAIDEARTRRPSYLSANLTSKAVCLIGCGSLGSGIARLLLQSGVGKIILIDPDALSWANIERHELGAQWVGQNKAQALATLFQRNFPLAEIDAHGEGWRDVYRSTPASLQSANLILSTCADWNAESALNDLQRTNAFQNPVLYGWLEESSLAAHALALGNDGPCLRCGFTATGAYKFPAVCAPNGTALGCAGGISLYGAIDMAPAQAMMAGVALDLLTKKAQPSLHRVWCCPKPMLDEAQADWSPYWISKHGVPPLGGTIVPAEWLAKKGCPCRS